MVKGQKLNHNCILGQRFVLSLGCGTFMITKKKQRKTSDAILKYLDSNAKKKKSEDYHSIPLSQ